jgi:hypothetical protein
MTRKIKVLFICRHNTGRSQIAEAHLKKFYGDYFEIESAGFEPLQEINPLVVRVISLQSDKADQLPTVNGATVISPKLPTRILSTSAATKGAFRVFADGSPFAIKSRNMVM